MFKKIIRLFIPLIFCIHSYIECVDLLIAGLLDFNIGLGKISYGLIDQLGDQFSISYYPTSLYSLEDDPYKIKLKIYKLDALDELSNQKGKIPDVFVYVESMQVLEEDDSYVTLPLKTIKYAYSMFESTVISSSAAERLNKYFDAVIVPDQFLIEVYKKSGVTLPIFCIPTGLYLDKFFALPLKSSSGKPFTFGVVSTRYERKNLKKLIRCFNDLYGNNSDYLLKIHAADYFQNGDLERFVEGLKVNNIRITSHLIDEEEYVHFIYDLDCYLLLSKGEGFSNTPREAMAAGIPIIISDNTGQSTIADSGYGIAVNCYEVDADYEGFIMNGGKQFDCDDFTVKNSLRKMVDEYEFYAAQRKEARDWVRVYTWNYLKKYYSTLFNPTSITLGSCNSVNPSTGIVQTENVHFYKKIVTLSA